MTGDDDAIPTLTDVVSLDASPGLSPEELAELREDLTLRLVRLTEQLMHSASLEVEAVLFERVADRLRAQLPELIDQVLRERLIR